MSLPLFEERSPGTFSRMKVCALVSSSNRQISQNNPDRFPASPARLPATERSWQGNPPTMIPSLGSNPAAISCSPVTSQTSLNKVVFGNLCLRTPLAFASISTAATTSIPLRSSAKSKPPTPAKSETAFISYPPIHRP